MNRGWNPRIVVWCIAGLVVVMTALFVVTAIALPGCSYCHSSSDFVAQTQARSHSDIDCLRCHVTQGFPARAAFAYNVVFGMALQVAPVSGGPATAIPDATCLSCHADVLTHSVTKNGLSILHSECTKRSTCSDCHADTAHGSAVKWVKTVDMNKCLECHNTSTVRSECDTCHEAKGETERIKTGEWTVTHNANWRQTHGMGSLNTCAACHPDDYCVKCHGIALPHGPNFMRSHSVFAATNRKDCAVCHQQTFCDSCHGMPMPHPATFTPLHSSLVKRDGKTACMRCHIDVDCSGCHERHVHPGGAKTPPGSADQ